MCILPVPSVEISISSHSFLSIQQVQGEGPPPPKRRKDSKGKKARNETASGDEDVIAGGSSEVLPPREAYKSAEQIRQELETRQASREEVKSILRAVLQISSGMSCDPY